MSVKTKISSTKKSIPSYKDLIPVYQSEYEFKNFLLERYPTPARQLSAVLQKIEELKALGKESSEKAKKVQVSLDIMEKWVQSIDSPETILKNYENEEPEYWAQTLGREAAIEIITLGKTTSETMTKMALLPLEDFEESVRVCIKFAELIRDTTERVEKDLTESTVNIVKT